jgi:hypothetical protein
VPGYSQATWTASQTNTLCAGLANLTSGYPTKYIRCEVKYVGNTIAPGFEPISVSSNGYLVWDAFLGMSAADQAAAVNSRDLFINTIKNNETLLTNIFSGANLNNTCSSAWTPVLGGNDYTTVLPVNGWATGGSCRMGVRGITAVSGTPSELNLPSVKTTVSTVGLDNGKVCPSGFIQRALPVTGGVTATADAKGALTCTAYTGGSTPYFSCQMSAVAAATVTGVMAGSVFDISGTDITSPTTAWGKGGTCNDAAVTALQASFVADPTQQAYYPPSVTAGVGTAANQFKFNVTASTGACTNGDAITIVSTVTGGTGNMKFTPYWSSACDKDPFFLKNNVPGIAGPSWGSVCPLCGNQPTNPIQLEYNGPNARKFCIPSPVGQMVNGDPTDVNAAGILGTSCIGPIGSTSAANQPYNGYPMLTPSAMSYLALTGAPQESVQDIFPTPTSLNKGTFAAGSVLAYDATMFQRVALDSEWNTPCSTPRLTGPAVATQTVGIVGGYELGQVSANPNVGAGSCNTQSMFFNGGATVAGVSDSYSEALLRAQFISAIQFPAPAPAPTPSPVTPSPKAPSPAKPPSPSPSPSPTPIVCTYSGNYNLKPLYAPCNNYFIASGTSSDCSNNYVNLRTGSQLGGKPARAVWKFATIAQDNLSTPTNVLATARTSCTNKYLAAPSDPSQGLKVGGSSWKWQFVPYPGSSKCDEVNMISQNRLSTTAFLEVPRTCDRFRYNATDGGRQRFRVTKV